MAECLCDLLTEGILQGCDNNRGGIKGLWLTDACNVTVAESSPLGYKEPSVAGASKFYKFHVGKNISTFTEVGTVSAENGTELYTQTISLVLNRREKSKRDTLLLLSKFKDLMAIVLDNNGLYWLVGESDFLMLTENNSESGTAKADRNGYTITMVAEEASPASEITAVHIASMLAANDIDTL